MISGLSIKVVARAVWALAPAALGLVVLSGCDNDYPQELQYALRTDPILAGKPSNPGVVTLDGPGDFEKPGEPPPIALKMTDKEKTADLLDPARLKPDERQKIQATLESLFGKPQHPKVDLKAAAGSEDNPAELQQAVDELKLDEPTLAKGSNLYRIHCLHCHGLTGNGRGPTSPWVNPHPRDYRQGIFKFTSTSQTELGNDRKPRRYDLLRTLREGIEGTSMPSFGLLSQDQLEALASYVIHLSIRGETEFQVMKQLLQPASGQGGDEENASVEERLKTWAKVLATQRWLPSQAEKNLIKPEVPAPEGEKDVAESVKRGYQLFQTAGCLGCHIDYGRKLDYRFDDWGTIVRPADLTTGVYRGGRRPIDLYWRIHSGINGANMPAAGRTPQEIWDLVNFVRTLPYPGMREKYAIPDIHP